MKCPVCQKPMLALFTSYVCEGCTGQSAVDSTLYWGYAPGYANCVGATFHVYKTLQECRDFVQAGRVKGHNYVINHVWSRVPFGYYQEPTKWLAYLTKDQALVGQMDLAFNVPYVGIAAVLPG